MKITQEIIDQIISLANNDGYVTERREWDLDDIKDKDFGTYESDFLIIIVKDKIRLFRFEGGLTEEEMGHMRKNIVEGMKKINKKLENGQPINICDGELFYGSKLLCAVIDRKVKVYLFKDPISYEGISSYLESLEG